MTLESVPFFTDDIKIKVEETNAAHLCGTTVTLRKFAGRHSVRLERIKETGEYVATLDTGLWIRGREEVAE
jgi:hypothetical protein